VFRHILIYGFSLGLLTALLQLFQYRLLIVRHAESWYIGIIALFFSGVGIWAGRKLNQKRKVENEALMPPAKNLPPAVQLEKLGITPREYEVLQLIAQGLSNQEIADQLFVSLNTVKTHTANVYAKLDAQRRTQAIQKAVMLGILGAS
jgi:two-component system, NarL family, response regulator LiaR